MAALEKNCDNPVPGENSRGNSVNAWIVNREIKRERESESESESERERERERKKRRKKNTWVQNRCILKESIELRAIDPWISMTKTFEFACFLLMCA